MATYPKTYPTINNITYYRSKSGSVSSSVNGRFTGNNGYKLSTSRSNNTDYNSHEWFSRAISILPAKDVTHTANRAYSKFIGELGTRASLGTGLAEIGDSISMITNRSIQLISAFKALRRFDLPRVAEILLIPEDAQRKIEQKVRRNGRIVKFKTDVSKSHYVASTWLEYWMGWAPLVGDISNAIDVMTQPIKSYDIKVASSFKMSAPTGSAKREYFGKDWVGGDGFYYRNYQRGTLSASIMRGNYATVQITNPNLFLANQLGFVNPVAVAWDLIPFSFILGWGVNVSQVINSYTDLFGLKLTNAGSFSLYKGSGSVRHTIVAYPQPVRDILGVFDGAAYTRSPGGIQGPSLVARLPDRLSLTRAATSISLLTSLFLKP